MEKLHVYRAISLTLSNSCPRCSRIEDFPLAVDQAMEPPASPPDATYGFIGLGNMGFGMAKNVRQKIPASSRLVVCELNKTARDEFCKTVDGDIVTADSPKEVAEQCVLLPGNT